MKVHFNKKTELNDIDLEETDLCYACENDIKCPLIQSIKYNLVYAKKEMNINYCELMKVNYD